MIGVELDCTKRAHTHKHNDVLMSMLVTVYCPMQPTYHYQIIIVLEVHNALATVLCNLLNEKPPSATEHACYIQKTLNITDAVVRLVTQSRPIHDQL
jgi:hypothetical protein